MKNEDIEDLAKSEQEYQEVKDWEESKTEDKFDTWKLKKLINERFIEGIVISAIITLAILKFF